MARNRRKVVGWRARWQQMVFDPAVVGRRWRLGVAALAVITLIGAQVWVRLQVDELGYRVQRTTAVIEKLDHEHSELLAELNSEKSPALLSERAHIILGLREPAAGQVVTVFAAEEDGA